MVGHCLSQRSTEHSYIFKTFVVVVVKTKEPITELMLSNISTVILFNYFCLAIANKIYL